MTIDINELFYVKYFSTVSYQTTLTVDIIFKIVKENFNNMDMFQVSHLSKWPYVFSEIEY